jgi:hypothetical protein
MTQSNEWLQQLINIGTAVSVLVGILTGLATLTKLLRQAAWTLRPVLAAATILATVAGPNLLLVWVWLYAAGENANRLSEAPVFLAITLQLALVVSAYTLIWGVWLYAPLSRWLRRVADGDSGPTLSERDL